VRGRLALAAENIEALNGAWQSGGNCRQRSLKRLKEPAFAHGVEIALPSKSPELLQSLPQPCLPHGSSQSFFNGSLFGLQPKDGHGFRDKVAVDFDFGPHRHFRVRKLIYLNPNAPQ